MPATDQLPQLSDAYMENSRWLLDHLSDVVRRHPNQWVAVHARHIVAADADLGVATAAATKCAPSTDTVFHFVDDGSLIYATFDAAPGS